MRNYLKKANPQTFEKSVCYTAHVEAEVINNPVAIELVVLCSTGQLHLDQIKDRFGTFGVETARSLVAKKILAEPKLDWFTVGSVRMSMSPQMVLKMGVQISANYGDSEAGDESGHHFHSFYAEGLTPEAYNAWLKIDEEAYAKKILVAKKSSSLGTLKVYTFGSTGTLAKKDNK